MLYLNGVQCAIPDERPSLFDLKDRYTVRPGELEVFHRIYGLDRVPVCREPLVDFLCTAIARLLDTTGVDPKQIKWLVYAHTASHHARESDALLNRVCRRLGMDHACSFGINSSKCASTIQGLRVLERLLAEEDEQPYAILVTADIAFTPDLQIIPNSSVVGDAAVACLLSAQVSGHSIVSTHVEVYGQHARCQWSLPEENAEFEDQYPKRMAQTITRALSKAGVDWADVRQVLPQNINAYSWKRVAKELGIPFKLIYLDQVPILAHCFGADIFLNWFFAEQEGRFRSGDYLVLATLGLGAVFGAAVIRYNGKEARESWM